MEISIVRSHNRYAIRAKNVQDTNEEVVKLCLTEEEGNSLLEENCYNYKEIVEKLEIKRGQLRIRGEGEEEEEEGRREDS